TIGNKAYQQAKNTSGISRAAFDAVRKQQERKKKAALSKPSFGTWLGKNVVAGAAQFNKSLVGTLDWLSPTLFDTNLKTGERNAFGKWMDKRIENQDKIINEAAKVNSKLGKLGTYAGLLTQGTVSAVPNLAAAVASGGTSASGSLGSTALSIDDDAVISTMKTLGTLAKEAAKKPAFWTSFSQAAGNSYNEAKAEGENETTATIYAMVNGAASAGVEVSGGIETLPSGRQLKNLIKSAVEEGNEEVIQNIVARAVKRVTYQNKPNVNPKDIPGELAEDWAMGTGVGLILGGARYGASKSADTIRAADETYRAGKAINEAGAAGDVVEAGRQFGENRAASKYADKLTGKMKTDKDGNTSGISNWQAGRQYVKNLEAIAEDAALAKAVRESSGANVRVRSDMPSWDNGNVNLKTRDISVSDKAETAFADTVKHETTHLAEHYAPEQYKSYEQSIIDAALKNDAAAVDRRRKALLELGYSIDEVDSELAAELSAPFLNNRAAIERLARSKTSFSEKMSDVISSAAAHVRDLRGQKYVTNNGITLTYAQLQRSELLWREAVRNSRTTESFGEGTRHLFNGDDNIPTPKSINVPGYGEAELEPSGKVRNWDVVTARMEPVATVKGTEFQKDSDVPLKARIRSYFNSIGNSVHHPILGDIALTNRSVSDSLAHDIWPEKIFMFQALPDVLTKGNIVDIQKNWKGRLYDTYVFAAPVNKVDVNNNTEEFFVAAVVKRQVDGNRYYVHDVMSVNEKGGFTPLQTGPVIPNTTGHLDTSGSEPPSLKSILRKIVAVKTFGENNSDIRESRKNNYVAL
ncbi:MAG: hypothetical protein Q4G33_15415, partial [bacterium]|nr:hypothetical protein [bacterium]